MLPVFKAVDTLVTHPCPKEIGTNYSNPMSFQGTVSVREPFSYATSAFAHVTVSQPHCLFAVLFGCHVSLPETSCSSEPVPLSSPTRCLCGQGTMA